MKCNQIILGMLLLFAAFSSCNSNDDNNPSQSDDTFAENFGNAVTKDFIGQIVDTNNDPVQNATVKIGNATTQTDANGVFIINSASVHEKFAYITATKAGYVDGSRALVPTSGKNNVKIMLIPNTPLETIQTGVVSEVSIYSGTKVKFDGAFQDESGNAYTGTVQVSMFHLTPSDENLNSLMPGMLYAQTQANQPAMLETFGMINVELRGSAGQKLNIKDGHTAEITMRIDDSQIATAPSSIPLWHFDEVKGYWKEDGIATKVGNKYVGEVSHFSWWNCDAPFPVVNLSLTVVDANGHPLSNTAVGFIKNGTSYPAIGFTDNQGHVSGLVPRNEVMTLHVYANYYGCTTTNIIHTASIGPLTTDTILPNIVIASSGTTLFSNVVGTLLKCDNTNVTNGYVMLSRPGGYSVSPVTNGSFSFNETYCPANTQFKLKAVDYDNLQQTDSISYNFSTPITNVGALKACNTVDEFITYKIDDNPTVFLLDAGVVYTSTSGAPGNVLYISGNSGVMNGQYIFIYSYISSIPVTTEGIYTTDNITIDGNGTQIGYITNETTNTLQFNLSHIGAVGDYVDMTVSGTYNDSNGISHTLHLVVHAKRNR